MSDNGNTIKNRLKMFEHNKVLLGQIGTGDVPPDRPTKLVASPIRKISVEASEPLAPRVTIVARPIRPPKAVPSVITNPSHLQKPPVRVPPSPDTVAAKTKPLEIFTKMETSPTEKEPSPNPRSHSKSSTAVGTEVIEPRSRGLPVKNVPLEIEPKLEVPSKAIISPKARPSNSPAKAVANSESESVTQSPRQKSTIPSPTSHPPPPPPPPPSSLNCDDKSKPMLEAVQHNGPPLVPPPPPNVSKFNSTTVIGWAGSTNSGSVNEKKNVESNKPPPIPVAPPSLETLEKCTNKNNNNSSRFPNNENDDAYDDDEDHVNSPWYFDVSKSEATNLMRDCNNVGTFMVRPSDQNQYVLMVRADIDMVKKFKLQPYKNGWILGDPTNSKRIHSTLSGLIDFYCQNGVKLGNSNLKLKEPVPKE